jgi:hypothetical protein
MNKDEKHIRVDKYPRHIELIDPGVVFVEINIQDIFRVDRNKIISALIDIQILFVKIEFGVVFVEIDIQYISASINIQNISA